MPFDMGGHMKRFVTAILCITLIVIGFGGDVESDNVTHKGELMIIEETIKNSIGWALDKDLDLLYSCLAHDDSFFIFNPDPSSIIGFKEFSEMAETVFMNEAFKATGYEVKDLRINLSRSGEVAWYSCFLDDYGEWNGESTSWINCRWTGVLEKRDGNWVITQMHFSFPRERG